MQFVDLAKQLETIRGTVEERIKTVLDHGNFILGPEIKELEKKLAAFDIMGNKRARRLLICSITHPYFNSIFGRIVSYAIMRVNDIYQTTSMASP